MPRVTLEAMTRAHFTDFMEAIFPPYVAERAAADHVCRRTAERYTRRQHARLLPDGHLTAGHRFERVVSADSGQAVDGVWFGVDDENKQAFLYYISILPEHRRRGFARAALVAVEEMVRAAGCVSFGLNVFSSNDGAMALYRKLRHGIKLLEQTAGLSRGSIASHVSRRQHLGASDTAPMPDPAFDRTA